MSLMLDKIYQHLTIYGCTFINKQVNLDIDDMIFFTAKTKKIEENVLYFAKVSQVVDKHQLFINGNFLLIEDVSFDELNSNLQGNYLLVNKDVDMLEIYNEIKSLFSDNIQSMKNATNLLHTLIHSRGLKYIVKRASEVLNNPVILLDSSFRILAHSKSEKIKEDFWHENIKKGYCSFEFISEVKKIDALKKAPNTAEPVVANCFASITQKLVSKVVVDDKVAGYIVSLESHESFNDKSHEFLLLLSNVISQEIKNNKSLTNMLGLMHEHLLLDILDGKIDDYKIIQERTKISEIKLKNKYQVLLLNITSYHPSTYYRDNLKNGLKRIFPNICPVFYKDYVIGLLNFNEDQYLEENRKNNLQEFLRENNLTCAVSEIFTGILDLPKYYQKCLATINLATKLEYNESLLYCEDHQFYLLLDLLTKKDNNVLLTDFCHPAVVHLQKYDTENETQYFETFCKFLWNNQNVNRTAKELFIHRNTMAYRLNKIKEITSLDFDDAQAMFHVLMSFKILQYVNLV